VPLTTKRKLADCRHCAALVVLAWVATAGHAQEKPQNTQENRFSRLYRMFMTPDDIKR
jgi:hypothetical protein